MPRCWVIAPYDSQKKPAFDRAWDFDLRNGTIAIGWRELGDVSKLSQRDLQERLSAVYGKNVKKDSNMIWRFYHEISPGDVVIARRGTKRIVGLGKVVGGGFYDEAMGKERVGASAEDYPNFIKVEWESRTIDFENIVFSFITMYEIPLEKYESLVEPGEPQIEEESGVVEEAEFPLEKYLEEFIVSNFATIFGKDLELYRDTDGGVGQQYPIVDNGQEIGKIDILAKEASTGAFVVIELKKGRESDRVIGQVLRYMGWVQENLCTQNQPVKGLIICKEKDSRLQYALKAIPPGIIAARCYAINFRMID